MSNTLKAHGWIAAQIDNFQATSVSLQASSHNQRLKTVQIQFVQLNNVILKKLLHPSWLQFGKELIRMTR